jgi:hypothetical protein
VRAPKANAICERTTGTIRRECLDYLIPLGERHWRSILAEWIAHFKGRIVRSVQLFLTHQLVRLAVTSIGTMTFAYGLNDNMTRRDDRLDVLLLIIRRATS